jgi:hypothetical protein
MDRRCGDCSKDEIAGWKRCGPVLSAVQKANKTTNGFARDSESKQRTYVLEKANKRLSAAREGGGNSTLDVPEKNVALVIWRTKPGSRRVRASKTAHIQIDTMSGKRKRNCRSGTV